MASIGSLVADLRLESAAFHRDLGKAATAIASDSAKMRQSMKAVEKASGDLNRQFSVLKNAAVALGAALAIRQFVQFTQAALDTADAVAKAADSIGLSTDALQEYQVAAGLSGVATEKFDAAMQKFTRSVGDARAGTGTLVTMLKDSDAAFLEQIKTAGTMDQALDLMFKKLAETENAFDRNALAAAAFGRSGVALVNMLGDGVQGLEDMRQQAVDLGLVLEEDLIRQAEAVNDRMSLLKGAFDTGFARSVIEEFAQQFQLTADNITVAREAGEKFGTLVGKAVAAVAEAAEFAARYMKEIAAGLGAIIAMKAATMFAAVASSVLALANAMVAATLRTKALSVAFAGMGKKLFSAGIGIAIAGMVLLSDKTVEVRDKTIELGRVFDALGQTIAQAYAAAAGNIWTAAMEDLGARIDTLDAAWSNLGPQVVETSDDASAALADLIGALDDMGSSTETATDKFADLVWNLQQERDIARALVDAHQQGAAAVEQVEIAAEVYHREQQLGIRLSGEQRRTLASLIRETRGYEDALGDLAAAQRGVTKDAADMVRAQKAAAAEAAKQAEDDAAKAAERAAEAAERPFLNAIDGIQGAFTDAFENIFSGGVTSFKDLAETVKGIFIKLAAEMATLLIFKPAMGSLMGATGMAGNLGVSGGGFGDLFGSGGSLGQMFAPGSLSGTLGSAGIGALAGGLLARFTGGNELGGSIGGGLGAAGGFLIGGPIGGVIGGLGGSVIGSLFGPKGSVGPNASARIGGNASDGFFVGGTGADNGGDLAGVTAEAQRAADALERIRRAFGLTVAASPSEVLPGRNYIGTGTAAGRGFQSAEAFVTAYLQGGGLSGGTAELDAVLRGSTASTLEENLSLLGSIPGLLGPATSAFDQAIQAVNDNFDTITQKAQEFGLALDKVTAAREAELAAVRAQAAAPYLADAGNIVDFLNAQSLSASSSLSPTSRLSEAQRQFNDLITRARGGEAGLSNAINTSASTLLGLGRDQYASSRDFASLESSVRSSLLSVATDFTSPDIVDRQVEATRQQTSVLSDGQDETNQRLDKLIREIQLLKLAQAS